MLEPAKDIKFEHEGEHASAMMLQITWCVGMDGKTHSTALLDLHAEDSCWKSRRYAMRIEDVPSEVSIDDAILHLTTVLHQVPDSKGEVI